MMAEYIKKADIGLTDFEIILCKGDYKEALKMLLDKIENLPAADVVERKSCNTCQWYEGVHNTPGHAPCSFWKIGGVMWNDFCSRWEKENG